MAQKKENALIGVQVSKKLKADFEAACHTRNTDSSKVIRAFVQMFIRRTFVGHVEVMLRAVKLIEKFSNDLDRVIVSSAEKKLKRRRA